MTAVRPEAHRASPAAAGVPVRPLTGVRGALAAAVDGPLVAVGISHRTATAALRERAALTEPAARALLGELRSTPEVTAAAVLSTCNRTELHALSAAPHPIEPLRGALAARGRLGGRAGLATAA